jgi:hypothetical protein
MKLTGMANVRRPKSDVFAVVDAASKQDLVNVKDLFVCRQLRHVIGTIAPAKVSICGVDECRRESYWSCGR